MADELDLEFGQLTLEVLRKLAAHVVVLEQRIKALEQAASPANKGFDETGMRGLMG